MDAQTIVIQNTISGFKLSEINIQVNQNQRTINLEGEVYVLVKIKDIGTVKITEPFQWQVTPTPKPIEKQPDKRIVTWLKNETEVQDQEILNLWEDQIKQAMDQAYETVCNRIRELESELVYFFV